MMTRNLTLWVLAFALVGSLAAGCGGMDPEQTEVGAIEQEWSTNTVNKVHQDMTKEAIDYINSNYADFRYTFNKDSAVSGNQDTDCMWWNCGSIDDYYGADPQYIPALHFMRARNTTSQVACATSKDKIITAGVNALAFYRAGNSSAFAYWTGHATHILQDATATGHARRSSTDLHILQKICVDLSSVPAGICKHSYSADFDYAWDGRSAEYIAAKKATIGFLLQLASLARANESDTATIRAKLDHVLTNQITTNNYGYTIGGAYSGYYNCATLPGNDTF